MPSAITDLKLFSVLMILYTPVITPRVAYMAAWLGDYLFGSALVVTATPPPAEYGQFILNYSDEPLAAPCHQVSPAGLLSEDGVREQEIAVSKGEEYPVVLFGQKPFDVLSAIFYLVSRYEEYLPYTPDEYGRYGHGNSLAYKYDFIKRPLVDEWMAAFKTEASRSFPGIAFKENRFIYTPTYDVDIAWSYRHKGFIRNLAGMLKDLFSGRTNVLADRISALSGRTRDPFDVFADLDTLHRHFGFQPVYFFLLAEKRRGYDKNISPGNRAYKALIARLAETNPAGIHLSWQASKSPKRMQKEKQRLERIIGQPVTSNRMHYLNFHLPATYEQLEENGITRDYSMGYGSINGFRASTCQPFRWYNLSKETMTGLTIYPFAYMEANSIFEEKQEPGDALESLQHFHDSVKQVNGHLVTIFHNHLVGYDDLGRKWWRIYGRFLGRNF